MQVVGELEELVGDFGVVSRDHDRASIARLVRAVNGAHVGGCVGIDANMRQGILSAIRSKKTSQALLAGSMNSDFLPDLTQTMSEYGFHQLPDTSGIADATLLLKRQTWNTNRAVVVVSPSEPPADFRGYLRELRRRVAFRCGFFPFFWGIGIQVVIVAPGILQSDVDPSQHVARVDNQWAIVQSVFLADPSSRTCCSARTWGQFVTGKFQDAISLTLSRYFEPVDRNA